MRFRARRRRVSLGRAQSQKPPTPAATIDSPRAMMTTRPWRSARCLGWILKPPRRGRSVCRSRPRAQQPRARPWHIRRGSRPRGVVCEEAGDLGEGEDEDQVEEQLQGRDPLLAPGPTSRQISLIGDVPRPPPVFIAPDYRRRGWSQLAMLGSSRLRRSPPCPYPGPQWRS
jgi:hypothetical protein